MHCCICTCTCVHGMKHSACNLILPPSLHPSLPPYLLHPFLPSSHPSLSASLPPSLFPPSLFPPSLPPSLPPSPSSLTPRAANKDAYSRENLSQPQVRQGPTAGGDCSAEGTVKEKHLKEVKGAFREAQEEVTHVTDK